MTRILQITSSRLPSMEANAVQVTAMAAAFAETHDVTLVGRRNGGATDQDVRDTLGLPGNVRLELDARRGGGWQSSIRYARAVRAMSRTHDLGFGRDPIGLLAARAGGLPVLYEIHHPPENRRRRLVEAALFRSKRTGVVFISEALARWYHANAPETAALPTIVAHDAAHPRPRSPEISSSRNTDHRPTVGYFGSLNAGKGIELITELAPRLREVDFHVVGGTPDQVSYWTQRQPGDNVIIEGWLPHSVILERMASMDVLIAPYKRSSFGAGGRVDLSAYMSPLKVFEYMSSGRPMVVSDLPVLREILDHRVSALLVDPDDLAGWEGAIFSLLQDSDLAALLTTQARAALEERFTWQRRASCILRLAVTV